MVLARDAKAPSALSDQPTRARRQAMKHAFSRTSGVGRENHARPIIDLIVLFRAASEKPCLILATARRSKIFGRAFRTGAAPRKIPAGRIFRGPVLKSGAAVFKISALRFWR